jgi:hypothetical protein
LSSIELKFHINRP